MKNIWSPEESEAIMENIINGDSLEVAKAKVLINKDETLGKEMADLYVPNVMTTDRAEEYKRISDEFVANRKLMIEIFGEQNLTCYNLSGKKNKLNALVTGVNKSKNASFKLKKSTGCYGIER